MRIRGALVALSVLALVATSAPLAAAAPVADPLPRRVLGKDWTVLPIKRKAVALTIDCGGNAAGLKSILATLKAEQVPATFFLTGNWVRTYPSKTKTLARRGFTLGNHTQTHPRAAPAEVERVLAPKSLTRAGDDRHLSVKPDRHRRSPDVTCELRLSTCASRLPCVEGGLA